MNILVCSYPYAPSVGGIETVSALLAEQFHRAGHDVTIVTQTPSREIDNLPWRVVRRPGSRALIGWHRWADVVLHNNISLRFAWPLLLVRRPWIVGHHTWLPRSGPGAMAAWLKRGVARLAHNVAVSQAVARTLPTPATVLPNPYAEWLFRPMEGIARERELVFVGRLVSDKGVPILLQALAKLHGRGLSANLTVVGDGPEHAALIREAESLGIAGSVVFAGRRSGAALAELLHRHRICIVPSVWEEPFGLVALEALACGCVPVVAHSGGLPEAVGPCGVVVPKGDPAALADALQALLAEPGRVAALLQGAPVHLAAHRAAAVARRYLELFDRAQRGHRPVRRAA